MCYPYSSTQLTECEITQVMNPMSSAVYIRYSHPRLSREFRVIVLSVRSRSSAGQSLVSGVNQIQCIPYLMQEPNSTNKSRYLDNNCTSSQMKPIFRPSLCPPQPSPAPASYVHRSRVDKPKVTTKKGSRIKLPALRLHTLDLLHSILE